MFLAWQTWDLLRIMHYGFLGFCSDFLERNPEHVIHPMRLNGSAVETIFSQLKYTSGGNLMSTNYSSSRASLLITRDVSWKHANDDYRNAPLFFRQRSLKNAVLNQ